MGKSKRQKRNLSLRVPYTKDARNKKPQALTSSPPTSKTSKTPQQAPTIPFDPQDRILLVGEGDFSFTLSLYTHHNCTSLIATCYDNAATLAEKYPQSGAHIRKLEDAPRDVGEQRDIKVLYGVDATKLGKCGAAGGGKVVRKGGFDRVMFNFPHVGGVTKDVNRQVRYNQELLVNFFKSAIPLLAPAGTIIVTVFEGEPYSLWNVRDLARHVGLQVARSFKFQSGAYPGYQHVRTLGNIKGGGGWKGEDRDARTYIFGRKDVEATWAQQTKQKKRKSESESESSHTDQDD